MKTLFSKLVLALFFIAFSSPNLYAEEKNEASTDAAVYTVTVEIGGLPGKYVFTYPEFKTVNYDGSENLNVSLSGTETAGTTGIIVQFQVTPTTSESTKFTVHSSLYNSVLDLDESGTNNVQFIVPFNAPAAQVGLFNW